MQTQRKLPLLLKTLTIYQSHLTISETGVGGVRDQTNQRIDNIHIVQYANS